jgi:sugar lactone lactonase YvrE
MKICGYSMSGCFRSSRVGWVVSARVVVSVGVLVLGGASVARAGGAECPPAGPAALLGVVAFDPTIGQLPESLAVGFVPGESASSFFVSVGTTVLKVDPEGVLSTLVQLPIAPEAFSSGIKFGPDGFLIVNSGGFDPALAASFVWRVSPVSGSVEQVAALDPAGFPNDLAFDGAGNIYVTDSFLGSIWRIDAGGQVSEWVSDPLLLGNPDAPALGAQAFGADGIAFDRERTNVYVSNLDFGTILRIPFEAGGRAAGPVELFAEDPLLIGADGIAFDREGTLYVAVNAQDRLATVGVDGQVGVLAEGGLLDGPSSLAFGADRADRKTLFLTNFAISRASGTQPGDPHPGILSLEVGRAGLPVP